ncbi:complement C1q-like protein 2 [Acanthopagrus latus]|uniref:complement C1q-like protein 2 n=1 Tax=Acanthopagrus latus TaxID=8177 RepID=UPI00187BE43C|nr:complement C1q-like protein 2 [Acanthopagrus latus]
MNFTILCFVLLLSGLVLAQDYSGTCSPNTCNLLRDLGARTEQLGAMETRLENCENQILELRKKVIFSAVATAGDKAIGPFDEDTTLIYNMVLTNIGNAYNPSTGIFAAPVAGVYYFSIYYHAGGAREGKLYLYKNGQLMIATTDHKSDSDTADNGGNAVFLQLQQGDRVYVQLPANCHVWGSDVHTTFNGFLVTIM